MKKVIAGHFDYIIEKQKIQVVANVPVMNEGAIVFEDDQVTPKMTTQIVEEEIDVRQRVWVPQREVDLTPEEIAQREKDTIEGGYDKEAQRLMNLVEKREKVMDRALRQQTEKLIMAAGNTIETEKIKNEFLDTKKSINDADTIEKLELIK